MTNVKKYIRKKNVIKGRATLMLSVDDISKKYHFHPHTIRAWVNRDGLRAEKHGPGRKIFIRQDDLDDFLKEWYELEN
ncbi:helix-turn-helix domain-containing protein [Chloroflexota bacterium]